MNANLRLLVGILVLTFLNVPATGGGVYEKSSSTSYSPAIIVHPRNYSGTGGLTTIKICMTGAAQAKLSADLEYAMRMWNELIPHSSNCSGTCDVPGEITPAASYYLSVHTTLAHELGHCALGLDHVNLITAAGTHTPYTAVRNYTTVSVHTDLVAGSKDDIVTVLPGALNLHWFRLSDNDPTIVDSTVIDTISYSRSYLSLPAGTGSSWIASANSKVGGLLGRPKTQAVMASAAPPNSDYIYLSADDVNTVAFAMNGVDPTPGAHSDNYTFALILEPNCATADVVVDFASIGADIGKCEYGIAVIPLGNGNHYHMGPALGQTQLKLTVNNAPPSGFVLHYLILVDGFENGTTSFWSDAVP